MTRTIEQSVEFKSSPAQLYELFMDSARHSAATGAPAKIDRKPGGKWFAHNRMIGGKTLFLVPNRMIVQSWRSQGWKASDPDSILIVRFEKSPRGARVKIVHVGVPSQDHAGVTKGWKNYYWKAWKKYLSK
jgi:activator of HSP90 ATPase